MTPQAILQKAIEKAIEGGFDWSSNFVVDTADELGSIHDGLICKFEDELVNVEAVVFNHEFAKALWGEEWLLRDYWVDRMTEYSRGNVLQSWQMGPSPWQYHLQQMVISPDPIRYLEENM